MGIEVQQKVLDWLIIVIEVQKQILKVCWIILAQSPYKMELFPIELTENCPTLIKIGILI